MAEPSIQPEVQPPHALKRRWQRHRTLVKLAGIGGLALAMLIPLALLVPVISERAAVRDGAVAEIERDWGDAQTIVGPVLVVPVGLHSIARPGWQMGENTVAR